MNIPTDPDWRGIVNDLYRIYRSYDGLLDALAIQGSLLDHSTLAKLRSGTHKVPRWPVGAALLNLHARHREIRYVYRPEDEPLDTHL